MVEKLLARLKFQTELKNDRQKQYAPDLRSCVHKNSEDD